MFRLLLECVCLFFLQQIKPQSSCKVCSYRKKGIIRFIIVCQSFVIDQFNLSNYPLASLLLTQTVGTKLQKYAAAYASFVRQ